MTSLEAERSRTVDHSQVTNLLPAESLNRLVPPASRLFDDMRQWPTAESKTPGGQREQFRSFGTPTSRDLLRGSLAGLAALGALFVPSASASVDVGTTIAQVRRLNEPRAETGENNPKRPAPPTAPAAAEGRGQSISPAEAVDELKSWLLLNDSEVSEVGGFARRSLTNWRGGSKAYGASSRRLFAAHALVAHLVAALGEDGMRLWLWADDGSGTGVSRADRLRHDDGLPIVLSMAERFLFERTAPFGSFDVNAGMSDREVAALQASARPATTVGDSPVRRVRKPPAR